MRSVFVIRYSLFVTRYSLFGIRCSVLTTNTLTTKIARFSKILILLVLAANALFAQNPHGNDLVIDCKACHLPSGWEIPTKFWELAISNDTSSFQAKQRVDRFDHQLTGFALTGRHERVDCRGCHQSLVFNKTESACVSCHTDVHSLSVGTDCARCHSTNHWLVENLSDIHLQNGFPLSGAHLIAHCTDCHVSDNQLVFNRIGNECINCHSVDYAGTTTPNHALVGYSVDCAKCHTNQSWAPASFDHTLFYPITGAHVQATCTDCHLNGVSAGTPTTCVGCHKTDFESTTNPDHQQNHFSTDCIQCHTNQSWSPATFDHNMLWPLTGAHTQVSCAKCHLNGNYNNTPNTCSGCHQSDFDATTQPPHAASGFPANCESCHTTSAWQPATWDHDGKYFPIYSGKHKGEWNSCVDCHTTPGNYNIFNCLNCHTANATNNEHDDVNGYQYSSAACYNCHPDGKE